jgi:hypothetical protein
MVVSKIFEEWQIRMVQTDHEKPRTRTEHVTSRRQVCCIKDKHAIHAAWHVISVGVKNEAPRGEAMLLRNVTRNWLKGTLLMKMNQIKCAAYDNNGLGVSPKHLSRSSKKKTIPCIYYVRSLIIVLTKINNYTCCTLQEMHVKSFHTLTQKSLELPKQFPYI